MPGLDEYNKFLQRREQEGESAKARARAVPQPGSDRNVRYVVRGGVTLAVPIDEPEIEGDIPATRLAEPPLPTKPRTVTRPASRIPAVALKTGVLPEEPRIPLLPPAHPATDAEGAALWERLPRQIQILGLMQETPAQAARTFEETRDQLIQRLLDPTLTLEETAKLLDVCTATVRRYANRGQLSHHRTIGQQRRFRLSDVLAFLERRAARSQDD